jgi:hypothetical protein
MTEPLTPRGRPINATIAAKPVTGLGTAEASSTQFASPLNSLDVTAKKSPLMKFYKRTELLTDSANLLNLNPRANPKPTWLTIAMIILAYRPLALIPTRTKRANLTL